MSEGLILPPLTSNASVKETFLKFSRLSRSDDHSKDESLVESLRTGAGNEWEVLQKFCAKCRIDQNIQLRLARANLFDRTRSLLQRILLVKDFKDKFSNQSLLIQELCDVFLPGVFLRSFEGLEVPEVSDEISFARFVIMSYIFGSQHIVDTIYDFLGALLRNHAVHLSISIFKYNFDKVASLLLDPNDIPTSAATRILRSLLSRNIEKELKIDTIVRLVLKYPVLGFSLARFQRLFQRKTFGDKYWENRSWSKPRLAGFSDLKPPYDFQPSFRSQQRCKQQTCLALIFDAISQSSYDPDLTVTQPPPRGTGVMTHLSEEGYYRLKQIYGYRLSGDLIKDSGINLDFERPLTLYRTYRAVKAQDTTICLTRGDIDIENSTSQMLAPQETSLEAVYETEETEYGSHLYAYDIATGAKRWIVRVTDHEGELVKDFYAYGK